MDPTLTHQRDELKSLVTRTRWTLRRNALWMGSALLVLAAALWIALGVALDLLVALPVPLRVAVWAGFWLIIIVMGVLVVLWPTLRPMSLEQVAFRIERILGNMHNRLVTVIDLAQRNGSTVEPGNATFIARLIEQTRQRMADYPLYRVADPRPARRATVLALLVVGALLAATLLLPDHLPNTLRRLAQPTQPIPPVAWVKLTANPGDQTVLEGEPVTLGATVERGSVEQLSVRITPDQGEPTRYPMQREPDGRFTFALSAVASSFDYSIEGGGTWTTPSRVTMLRRPIVQHVTGQIQLPAYMNLPQPTEVTSPTEQISAPVGSTLTLSAQVRGDAVRGQIHLFRTVTEQVEQTDARETVWFDDELPSDAEHFGQWRWIEQPIHSGARAHTFSWDRATYGFRTRLDMLTVTPDDLLFVYLRLDEQSPADVVRVSFLIDRTDEVRHAVFHRPGHGKADADASAAPSELFQDAHHVAKLATPPGEWVRLTMTPAQLGLETRPDRPVVLSGMRFAVAGGQVVFDRAGTLRERTSTLEQVRHEPAGSHPMQFDEQAGIWTGAVPIEQDGRYALSFENALGHASATMRPVPVVAMRDQPPTLVIERPGRNVTLETLEPVPMIVRAFDDYGLATVAVQAGKSAETLSESRELANYDEPRTSRLVTAALDPRTHALEPGDAIYYRVVVRDRLGQEAVSEPFRLARAGGANDTEIDRQRGGVLAGLLDGVGELVSLQGKLASEVADLLRKLPAGDDELLDEAGLVQLTNPDGSPLSAEQLAELLAGFAAQMDNQEREAWSQLQQEMAAERERLAALGESLNAAAREAEGSVQALPIEPKMLQMMAAQAQQLAAAMPSGEGMDGEALGQLLDWQQQSSGQQEQLESLQQQMQQMAAMNESLAADPDMAQQQLAQMMAELQMQQQMQQLRTLDQFMQQQMQQLAELYARSGALRERTAEAEPSELTDQISPQQQALDAEAIAAMERAQQLARAPEDEPIALPPAPWTPPAQEAAAPQEQDTPAPAEDAAADAPAEAQAEAQAEDWWDQPVQTPAAAGAEPDERYADRERPVEQPATEADEQAAENPASTPDAAPGEPGQTPREMLMAHQDALGQSLEANRQALSDSQQELAALREQMGGEQAMSAEQMQQMQAMAAQASMQAMQMRMQMQGQSMPGQGDGEMPDVQPGEVMDFELGMFDMPAGESAGMYRLPPSLRQPLMQGMSERGPDAYQRMIDAYYRQLSETGEE